MADAKNDGPNQDGLTVSQDKFANPHEKALYNLDTATDAHGIERVLGATNDAFIPAAVEASQQEKDAADRRNKMFDEASKRRQEQATGDIKDADRAVNNPADGGSQSATLTQAEADAKAKATADAAKADNKNGSNA